MRKRTRCKVHEWTTTNQRGIVACVHCPKRIKQSTLDKLTRARGIARMLRDKRKGETEMSNLLHVETTAGALQRGDIVRFPSFGTGDDSGMILITRIASSGDWIRVYGDKGEQWTGPRSFPLIRVEIA